MISNVIDRINHEYAKMSKGQKLIADYILKEYDKAAFMTAATLSKLVGVSESTVVPVSYTHLDVYKRQVLFPARIW